MVDNHTMLKDLRERIHEHPGTKTDLIRAVDALIDEIDTLRMILDSFGILGYVQQKCPDELRVWERRGVFLGKLRGLGTDKKSLIVSLEELEILKDPSIAFDTPVRITVEIDSPPQAKKKAKKKAVKDVQG